MTTDPKYAVDNSDMDLLVPEEDQKEARKITSRMLRKPGDLTVLQDNVPGKVLEDLPNSVKRRIKALKQLQLITTNIESKFYEDLHRLECTYFKMCVPMYEKRSEIVSGLYEPTDDQCVWESEDEEENLTKELKTKVKIEDITEQENDDVKGIPYFWLTIFKNVGMLAEMVQEHDEPILKYLHDIKVVFPEDNSMDFILEFHFKPNEYFSNSVLTKEYIMKCTPEKNDPFSFEGPEIYKSKGCTIDWKKGKNVTIKTIKKNQKHKSRGSMRTVTKTVQNDSFFNFFSPPTVPEDCEVDEDIGVLLTTDFEIGHYIREHIVPKAVLYYTGEVLEDEEEEDLSEEDDVDDDDEEDEEDNNMVSGGKPQSDAPAECKQQ